MAFISTFHQHIGVNLKLRTSLSKLNTQPIQDRTLKAYSLVLLVCVFILLLLLDVTLLFPVVFALFELRHLVAIVGVVVAWLVALFFGLEFFGPQEIHPSLLLLLLRQLSVGFLLWVCVCGTRVYESEQRLHQSINLTANHRADHKVSTKDNRNPSVCMNPLN